MSTNFAIIGGDLRMIKLAKMLVEEKNTVYTYGLELAEELQGIRNINFSENLSVINQKTEIIIGSIPFSSNGKEINHPFSQKNLLIKKILPYFHGKTLIAGNISQEVYDLAKKESVKLIDIMQREELAIGNAISTAEGAIEIAMSNTSQIIHGARVLILGFGRIGKILAKKLDGLSSVVTCSARKKEDLAWIKAYGYKAINSNQLGENLSQYDIIINTIPHLILTRRKNAICKKRMFIN